MVGLDDRVSGAVRNCCSTRDSRITEVVMAVPKSKITPSRRGMRRSHDRLPGATYIEDKDSGELRRPHHIDLKSGKYRGRQVLEPQDD